MRSIRYATLGAVLAIVAGCGSQNPSPASPGSNVGAVSTVATGLRAPWGVAFLPGGDALVTERDTHRILRVTSAGTVSTAQSFSEIDGKGEGGLLGIAVPKDYATSKQVYVYYSTKTDNRIARMRLGQRPQPILTGLPVGRIHNGGRIAFGTDGMLYAGVGETGERDKAQDKSFLGGKILRITPAGNPAPGNPFPNSPVWTYGHRNVQGMAWDSAGRMYADEFGQDNYDELNRIQKGKNYGWPSVEGASKDPRFVTPLRTWTPNDASPSGITIADGAIWMAGLGGHRLWRIPEKADGSVGTPTQSLVDTYGRLRDVVAAPDGSLWILTSNRDRRGKPRAGDDKILRLKPAQ